MKKSVIVFVMIAGVLILSSCMQSQDGGSVFPLSESSRMTILVNNTSDESVAVYVDGKRVTTVSPRKLGRFSVKKDVDSHTIRVRGESSGLSSVFRKKGEPKPEKTTWDGELELEWFDQDKMPLREIEISSGGGIGTKYQTRR